MQKPNIFDSLVWKYVSQFSHTGEKPPNGSQIIKSDSSHEVDGKTALPLMPLNTLNLSYVPQQSRYLFW